MWERLSQLPFIFSEDHDFYFFLGTATEGLNLKNNFPEIPDEYLQGASYLTVPEAFGIFDTINCLAPTLSDSALLNWRGYRLGGLPVSIRSLLQEYDVIGGYQDSLTSRPNIHITKLGVILPWIEFPTRETIITSVEPWVPENTPLFIFEANYEIWGGPIVHFWDLYDPHLPAFGMNDNENDAGIIGILPQTSYPITQLSAIQAPIEQIGAQIGEEIIRRAEEMDRQANIILWLPATLPPLLPKSRKEQPCQACLRLAPYRILCRKHNI